MKQQYYKLPLDFSRLLENGGGELEKCSEVESVNQNIELILTTAPGRHRFDPNFGCKIWDLDFQVVSSEEKWKKLFEEYVTEAIVKYEHRLSDMIITVDLHDVVREERLSYAVQVRKRADVYVVGTLNSNGEQLRLRYTLYLGPLSNE